MDPSPDRRSSAVEDYLKTIYSFTERGDTPASTSRLAGQLGVTPSTVSGMLRKLADLGLVAHRPYGGVTLTDTGNRRALAVVRRHRLLETYLVAELGYRWDEVHDEAEILEHHISDKLLARIDARLGHPDLDPHGDPIPTASGDVGTVTGRRLSTLDIGDRGPLIRVDDTDPAMLRYLDEQHLGLGDVLEIVERRPFLGPFIARRHRPATQLDPAAGSDHEIAPALAAAMWIDTGN